uniref:Uncharacterized protein n=1 Tax=Rhizophora mucronata TaxID=61149 RepID=A0A2P2LYJ1_RHIMU
MPVYNEWQNFQLLKWQYSISFSIFGTFTGLVSEIAMAKMCNIIMKFQLYCNIGILFRFFCHDGWCGYRTS